MKRTPLPLFEGFIETPFEQRFLGLLRQAWKLRRWHVIVADPGSGKTMGIRDLSTTAQREAGMVGGRRYPVLAVTAPKNDPKEAALGNFLLTALGLGGRGRWSERKYLLFELLVQYGVECLVIDDAHDLSMPHLIFLKELTDQLKLAYPPYVLGLCLVTAGRGASIPLKDVFDQPETMWLQFRHRLDRVHPYCRVVNHTEAEVRDILLALERIYRPSFPELNLRQWTGSIYTWLTHPLLDPQKSGRVIMDHLMKLVTTALELSYEEAEIDVSSKHLEAAAGLLLQRDTIRMIDGAEPSVEVHPKDTTEQGSVQKAEAGETKVNDPPKQDSPHCDEEEGAQTEVQFAGCSFSGPIELDVVRVVQSTTLEVQCPSCGSVRKAKVKGQSVVIMPHEPRTKRAVRNVSRWVQQGTEWVLVQKKEPVS
jgi:AAA domain